MWTDREPGRTSSMGCDIHIYVEQRQADGSWSKVDWPSARPDDYIDGPFDWRSYGVFGFLGYEGRNYSEVPALAEIRGLPEDVSTSVREDSDGIDWHSHSWLSVDELSAFDYAQTFEDRRVTVQTGPRTFNGGATAEPGGGQVVSYREFLGDSFMNDLATLTAMNAVRATRVVFWFDS